MEARTYIIVGGVVLVIGLLSFFMGSTKRAETHYADAETLYQHRDYQGAIVKYQKAIKASKKLGAKTKHIHKDFPGLANYKIALCYDKLGETKNDNRFYAKAISLIDKTKDETTEYQLREKLYFLWAQILRKTEDYVQAELKYSYFLSEFPNSAMVHEALYYDGIINKELLRYKDSQESFQRIIDEFPTSKHRDEAEYYKAQVMIQENGHQPISDNKSEDQKLYETALKMMQENKVYDAYQLLLAIINRHPNSSLISDTYEKLGDLFYNAENYVNARKYYDDAINSTTDVQRKQILIDKNHQTLLIPDTTERISENKQTNRLFIDPTIYRKEGKYLEAAKLYETLSKPDITSNVDIHSDDKIYALYWSGFCYYKAAQEKHDASLFEKSIELFRRLIYDHRQTSANIKTYFYLASAYYAISDYELVLDTVDEAEKNVINNMNSDYNIWYNQLKDLKRKVERKLNPNPVLPIPKKPEEKIVAEGRKHYNNDDFIEATKKAREALDISTNYQPAKQLLTDIRDRYYAYGWTFFDENLYDYAIDKFEKCISIDPNYKKAYCNLGVIYIIKKNYSSAINVLKQAIDIDRNFKEAHYNIGLAYLKLGKYDDAKKAVYTTLAIDPNYEAAKTLRDSIAD